MIATIQYPPETITALLTGFICGLILAYLCYKAARDML